MGITFECQDFNMETYLEGRSLTEINKEETGLADWQLDPDIWTYLNSDCKLFTARNEVGDIVGYATYFIRKHHHYGRMVAVQDILFLIPEARKGTTGLRFLKFIESSLRELKIEGMLVSSTTKKDISRLLERLNFSPVETLHFKEL